MNQKANYCRETTMQEKLYEKMIRKNKPTTLNNVYQSGIMFALHTYNKVVHQ